MNFNVAEVTVSVVLAETEPEVAVITDEPVVPVSVARPPPAPLVMVATAAFAGLHVNDGLAVKL
jgi:hypothetical protein